MYILPEVKNFLTDSVLTPFFERVRGNIKPGAERLQSLLFPWLEQGILDIPSVLVSGTNGKGSTCAFIESLLRQHKFKTGLYTSPHLIHPSERIRINGIPVTESLLKNAIKQILQSATINLIDASFFEISTAAALLIFLKEGIDFLICEVGLGGRLDSTNAIAPTVSVLTSVSLEHTEFLGSNLYSIAFDKSHISRRNKFYFVSSSLSKEALNGVKDAVDKIGSYMSFSNESLSKQAEENLNIANQNYFFASSNQNNLRLAYHVIEKLSSNFNFTLNNNYILKGIESTFWPGRFDIRKIHHQTIIFDAAHNPESFSYFLQQYKRSFLSQKKCILLFSSLSDKDWKSSLKSILEICEIIIITQTPSNRAESIEHFKKYLEAESLLFSKLIINIEVSLDIAIEKCMNYNINLPVVVSGSIAFIGFVMQRMNIKVFPNV